MQSSFKFVLAFTLAYGVLGLSLLAGQPQAGAAQTADAGGNFEVPMSDFGFVGKLRYASAE